MVANTFLTNVINLRWDDIQPDPEQPRKHFDEAGLLQLAESLKSNGLLQPIIVRPDPTNHPKAKRYIIIAGERRWRAASILQWETMPAIVHRNISLQDAAKLQLLENIVRQDLNPVEEAQAFKKMLDEGYSLQELAETVGLASCQISWRVQMLSARPDVLDLVAKGHIKPSIAHELSKLSPNGQGRALRVITSEKLSYNEVLALCQKIWGEEHQVEMFADTRLTDDEQRAARTFADAFSRIGSVLTRLQRMEDKQPGLMAQALAAECTVVESQVDETLRGLYRVKKALQGSRVRALAEVA
jgi:ParB family chromosome partitioning protein